MTHLFFVHELFTSNCLRPCLAWSCRESDVIPNKELAIVKKPDGTPWVLGQGSYGQVTLRFCLWELPFLCRPPLLWVRVRHCTFGPRLSFGLQQTSGRHLASAQQQGLGRAEGSTDACVFRPDLCVHTRLSSVDFSSMDFSSKDFTGIPHGFLVQGFHVDFTWISRPPLPGSICRFMSESHFKMVTVCAKTASSLRLVYHQPCHEEPVCLRN